LCCRFQEQMLRHCRYILTGFDMHDAGNLLLASMQAVHLSCK
jgi:hypothetical protein